MPALSFHLFNRSGGLSDYRKLSIDMHSHLLPGIDDGAPDVKTSFKLIDGLVAIGFDHLYTTPHIMTSHYPNTRRTIEKALGKLKPGLAERGMDGKLLAAAEYQLDEKFAARMNNDKLLTLPGRRVLVEMSFKGPLPLLEKTLFDLQLKGYLPVMAHPERYRYWSGDLKEWKRIRERGCELQVNLPSLMGAYGKRARHTALELIRAGWVSFLGTDCHNLNHLELLRAGLRDRTVTRILSEYEFLNHHLV